MQTDTFAGLSSLPLKQIALLEFTNHLAVPMLGALNLHHRLMDIGIELLSLRIDLLHTMFLQATQELFLEELEPLPERLKVVGIAGMLQGPVHPVNERQDIPEQIFVAVLNRVSLLSLAARFR